MPTLYGRKNIYQMNKYRLTDKLKRYRHIVNIVSKYGFGIIVEKIHLGKLFRIPIKYKKRESLSAPVRVRKMLEELGPTFIKLGQILSTRPDFVPLPYIRELEKLQDNTTKIPFDKIEEVFFNEHQKNISDIFSYFEEEPFASASISQVHRAEYQGNEVVVKIQKPDIEEQIDTDISIMYDIAALIEKFIKEADIYQPVCIVQEFEKMLKKELNFFLEAHNIERFRKNFENEKDIYVPFVYKELTTKKVLTLEFIDGIKISDIDKLDKECLDKKRISQIGLNSIMKQVFVDGFFHGDPHPANILVTRNCKLCFIDFGIVGRINEERRLELIHIFSGLMDGDSSKILDSLEMMGALQEDTDTKNFKEEIEDMLDCYKNVPIKELDINLLLEDSFSIMRKYYIKIPSNLTILIKTLITLEGIGLSLDPDFSIAVSMKPFVTKFISERIRIKNIFKDAVNISYGMFRVFKEMPASFTSFLKMLKKGSISISFEHKGLRELINIIDKSSSRLSFSLIIASLIISSSLIMVSGAAPLIFGFPAFGVVFFCVSAILGIWLIIDIIKHRSL